MTQHVNFEPRLSRTALIKISEARNLSKGVPGSYCEIYSDDSLLGRTTTKWKDPNPFWGEEMRLVLVPDDEVLVFVLCRDTKKQKQLIQVPEKLNQNKILGYTIMTLKDLKENECSEEWFNLVVEKDDGIQKTKIDIRISINFEVTTVLVPRNYERVLDLLLDKDYLIFDLLADNSGLGSKDRSDIAELICNITEAVGVAPNVLSHLLAEQIKETPNKEVLFRGNSVASKALDYYMKMVGLPWLECLRSFIQEIVNADDFPCEVLESKLDPTANIEDNILNLRVLVVNSIKTICSNAHKCPENLKFIFNSIRNCVSEKFPGDEEAKYTSVSGFLFLRFFVPAIMTPKLFGLMDDYADEETARQLTLIATVLQKLGNLQIFETREAYFFRLNPTLLQYTPQLKEFIDAVSRPEARTVIGRKIRKKINQLELSEAVARLCGWLYKLVESKKDVPIVSLLIPALMELQKQEIKMRELLDKRQEFYKKFSYNNNNNPNSVRPDLINNNLTIRTDLNNKRSQSAGILNQRDRPPENILGGGNRLSYQGCALSVITENIRPPHKAALVRRRAENIERRTLSKTIEILEPSSPNSVDTETPTPSPVAVPRTTLAITLTSASGSSTGIAQDDFGIPSSGNRRDSLMSPRNLAQSYPASLPSPRNLSQSSVSLPSPRNLTQSYPVSLPSPRNLAQGYPTFLPTPRGRNLPYQAVTALGNLLCYGCRREILDGNGLSALKRYYHWECFQCNTCHRQLDSTTFYQVGDDPSCTHCLVNGGWVSY